MGGARTLAGFLGATSLGQVVFELLDAEDTGTLLIYDAEDALYAAVLFERGYPIAALADVDSEHNVATLLIPLFGWDDGRFEFLSGADVVGEDAVVRGRVDPLQLITAASRGCMRECWIEKSMGLIDRGLIQRSRRLDPNRYGFTAQERLLIAAIEPGMVDLDELREQSWVAEDVLRRVLHVLWLTRGISLVPKERMVSGTIQRSQRPPAREDATVQVEIPAHAARQRSFPKPG